MELLTTIFILLIIAINVYNNFFKYESPVDKEYKLFLEKKKTRIKWRINQNLEVKKRKDAIYKLLEVFDLSDIKIDRKNDSDYVIIKIKKDVLIEREIE